MCLWAFSRDFLKNLEIGHDCPISKKVKKIEEKTPTSNINAQERGKIRGIAVRLLLVKPLRLTKDNLNQPGVNKTKQHRRRRSTTTEAKRAAQHGRRRYKPQKKLHCTRDLLASFLHHFLRSKIMILYETCLSLNVGLLVCALDLIKQNNTQGANQTQAESKVNTRLTDGPPLHI